MSIVVLAVEVSACAHVVRPLAVARRVLDRDHQLKRFALLSTIVLINAVDRAALVVVLLVKVTVDFRHARYDGHAAVPGTLGAIGRRTLAHAVGDSLRH